MSFTITEYCDVRHTARQLGLNEPQGLALLPRNFSDAKSIDELIHESAIQTVRKLFRENNIQETRLEHEGQKFPCIQENEFSLLIPTIFVSGLILSQNPNLLSVALSIIANYATDFFRGLPGNNKVRLDVVVEDKASKRSKRIHYEGKADGLKEIADIAGKVFSDEQAN